MRKKVVAANWKMNKTASEAKTFLETIVDDISNEDAIIYIIPPFLSIPIVAEMIKGKGIKLGAQNLYFEESGAYTGEVSAAMLKEAGVEGVIIGHSERRGLFNETDEVINKKIKKALEYDLEPIVCCGESLEVRKAGQAKDWVKKQIEAAFEGLSEEEASKCIVAYEPIWAIGTGEVASSDQAEEICAVIRDTIKALYSDNLANKMPILYGGSCNASNCDELFARENIDGGLIGGAGLKKEFVQIVKCGGK